MEVCGVLGLVAGQCGSPAGMGSCMIYEISILDHLLQSPSPLRPLSTFSFFDPPPLYLLPSILRIHVRR